MRSKRGFYRAANQAILKIDNKLFLLSAGEFSFYVFIHLSAKINILIGYISKWFLWGEGKGGQSFFNI